MKLSARNQLRGTITRIELGPISAEVEIAVGQQVLVAQITSHAVENLGLKVGQPAYAVIKASNIMIGVED
jgi:molybdopterin-binding protein